MKLIQKNLKKYVKKLESKDCVNGTIIYKKYIIIYY